ncbi:hypothetical protein ACN28E_21065 [Archangium lansingense]|uniref:hypothetical protein n=1 Tax=Archangium lansingense TaxID=2995310 RepID=UPI003B7EB24C
MELQDGEDYTYLPGIGGAVIGHAVRYHTEGYSGLGRLVRLGHAAFADLIAQGHVSPGELEDTGLLLNLSDGYFLKERSERQEKSSPGYTPDDETDNAEGYLQFQQECEEQLIPRLCEPMGLRFHPKHRKLFFGGPAGFASILRTASELIQSGQLKRCIVGGIDSLIDPLMIHALTELGVLKTPSHPVGQMPGEAAALLLLERHAQVRVRAARIDALLAEPHIEEEHVHRFSGQQPRGIALVKAISRALPQQSGQTPKLLIGNLNGDEWRAREWGMALTKLPPALRDARLWIPALSFGEIGAATGAVAACMGVRAFARGYARTEDVLIWLSSDNGQKGAFRITQSR